MDGKLMHHAILRGTDIDALKLVLSGDLLLYEFRSLGTDFGQILANFSTHVLVNLDDLQLCLGDLAPGLRDVGYELPALAFEPHSIPFQARHPRVGDEILLPQGAYPRELLLDPIDLLVFGDLLRFIPTDLFFQLGNALPELRLLPFPCLATDREQFALFTHHMRHIGIVKAREELARNENLAGPLPLGFLSCLPRSKLV